MLNLIIYDNPLIIPFKKDTSGTHNDTSNKVRYCMKCTIFHVDVIRKLLY